MHLILEKATYLISEQTGSGLIPLKKLIVQKLKPPIMPCVRGWIGSRVQLTQKGCLWMRDRVFILINIFIERKFSPGSICLLILIYPVSLNGFCAGKETVQPLDRDDRARRREGWFFCCCLWASVLEKLPQSFVTIPYRLCHARVCKSSTRETGEEIYLEYVDDR